MSQAKMYQALEQGRERSDRDSSMPYNLEQHLCTQNWKKTPSHQIQSKKEEKEQPVCQPATLSIFLIFTSCCRYFSACQNVPLSIPSDSHTPENKRVKAYSADRHVLGLDSGTFSLQHSC